MRQKRTGDNAVIRHKGKQIMQTTYTIIPAEHPDDQWWITTMGDRLDLLAKQFYGNHHAWYFIARVNNLNTITVDPGIKLRIPRVVTELK